MCLPTKCNSDESGIFERTDWHGTLIKHSQRLFLAPPKKQLNSNPNSEQVWQLVEKEMQLVCASGRLKYDKDTVSMTGHHNLSMSLSLDREQWNKASISDNCDRDIVSIQCEHTTHWAKKAFQFSLSYGHYDLIWCKYYAVDSISTEWKRRSFLIRSYLLSQKQPSPVSIWLLVSACLCLEVIPIVPDVIILITTINTNTIISSPASPKQHTLQGTQIVKI